MGIEIRIAASSDGGTVRELIAGFRDHLGVNTPSDAALVDYMQTALADPDAEFCCAFSRVGDGLGYAYSRFFRSIWAAGIEAHLEDLFVVPRARGKGLGRQLLEFALARARDRGARVMALNTNQLNETALRLYESVGFRAAEYSLYPGGREIKMGKWLEE